MKKLITFEDYSKEELDNLDNVRRAFDGTDSLSSKSNDESTKEELRKQINDLINKFENTYGTWSRINYKGGF